MEYRQFIPSTLDIDQLILSYPPEKEKKIQRDKLVHIVNLISEVPAFNTDVITEDGFVPLHSQRLQKHSIKNYKYHLGYLIEHGIIECDGHYLPGRKSYAYRFTSAYRSSLKKVYITSYKVIKAIKRDTVKTTLPTNPNHHLTKWFNEDLKIDEKGAKEWAWLQYKANVRAGKKNAYAKYCAAVMSIEKIANQDFYTSVDGTVGRFHSNLTNMKSELRNFISFGGQKLVSLDIVNSQPLIASTLLDPGLYTGRENRPRLSSRLYLSDLHPDIHHKITTTPTNTPTTLPYIMLVSNAVPLEGQDIQTYRELVSKGVLYEYIEEHVNSASHRPISKFDRKKVKTGIFQTFFSDNRFIGQAKALPKRMFRDLFPSVYGLFAFIKKTDKSQLAILLQTMESEVMLNRVARRIHQERPYLPIFTIHDSITTIEGNEDYVRQVMVEEIEKALEVTPALKEDHWTSSSLDWNSMLRKAGIHKAA